MIFIKYKHEGITMAVYKKRTVSNRTKGVSTNRKRSRHGKERNETNKKESNEGLKVFCGTPMVNRTAILGNYFQKNGRIFYTTRIKAESVREKGDRIFYSESEKAYYIKHIQKPFWGW